MLYSYKLELLGFFNLLAVNFLNYFSVDGPEVCEKNSEHVI